MTIEDARLIEDRLGRPALDVSLRGPGGESWLWYLPRSLMGHPLFDNFERSLDGPELVRRDLPDWLEDVRGQSAILQVQPRTLSPGVVITEYIWSREESSWATTTVLCATAMARS